MAVTEDKNACKICRAMASNQRVGLALVLEISENGGGCIPGIFGSQRLWGLRTDGLQCPYQRIITWEVLLEQLPCEHVTTRRPLDASSTTGQSSLQTPLQGQDA